MLFNESLSSRIEILLELQCSVSWFYSIELFPKGEDGDITGLRYLDVVALHNGTLRAAASLFIGPGILELDNPLVTRDPGGGGGGAGGQVAAAEYKQ